MKEGEYMKDVYKNKIQEGNYLWLISIGSENQDLNQGSDNIYLISSELGKLYIRINGKKIWIEDLEDKNIYKIFTFEDLEAL